MSLLWASGGVPGGCLSEAMPSLCNSMPQTPLNSWRGQSSSKSITSAPDRSSLHGWKLPTKGGTVPLFLANPQ